MPEIKIKAADGGSFMAYMATPKTSPAGVIVVIQEIFGVNQVMRDICDDLASDGFITLCPDLFWRQEPGIQITDQTEAEWARAFQLFNGFDVEKGVSDLIETIKAARSLDGGNGKVGTIGFCLGGKMAYLMATRSDADCNVSYYGVGIQDLLGESGKIKNPLLMHIAALDKFVPKEAQDKILAGLKGHPRVEAHVYPDVDHAFARVGGEHYNKEAATLAHQRTAAFLKNNLS
jgi:carboxymethylenebutenolidase